MYNNSSKIKMKNSSSDAYPVVALLHVSVVKLGVIT